MIIKLDKYIQKLNKALFKGMQKFIIRICFCCYMVQIPWYSGVNVEFKLRFSFYIYCAGAIRAPVVELKFNSCQGECPRIMTVYILHNFNGFTFILYFDQISFKNCYFTKKNHQKGAKQNLDVVNLVSCSSFI